VGGIGYRAQHKAWGLLELRARAGVGHRGVERARPPGAHPRQDRRRRRRPGAGDYRGVRFVVRTEVTEVRGYSK
jgi:hypothetical protein